ncbi:MAG TPA: EAL domain-containing protein [Kofleriaceae bacterium]|nr:EAL domain-containing protein [Kofleriaceae bacterium]
MIATADGVEQSAEAFLRQIINLVPHFIFAKDAEGRFVLVNQAMASAYGCTVADIEGRTDADFSSAEETANFRRDDLEVMRSGQPKTIEAEPNTDARGERRMLTTVKIPFTFSGSASPGVLGVATDITERLRDQAHIEFLAHHDSLTGLPNRARLENYLRGPLTQTEPFTLFFLDLDHFKDINDSLGHGVGDAFLRIVATRLRAALGADDFICRAGGDEFIVVLRGAAGAAARARVQALVELLDEPITVEAISLSISGSAGAAVFPVDGTSTEMLMKHADAALYSAKANGRNTFEFFTPVLKAAAERRLSTMNGLRNAATRAEFTLHYQPIVSAGSHAWVATEALLRWQSPELGAVSPSEFIPLAEETGLIAGVGLWVMREACSAQTRWAQRNVDLNISINISARQLVMPTFESTFRAICQQTGARLDRLTLEVTEGVFLADANASRMLRSLADSGVAVSIDDFGAGYSSLGYLKKLPLSYLKIDRSFVNECTQSPDDAAIVRGIVALAKNLRLKVVAEGVETAAQAAFLEGTGCDELQGFLYSRPVAESTLLDGAALHAVAARRA